MNGSFRFGGDYFPELTRLQQQLDDIFQSGISSNIRALSRSAFPAINLGASAETIEVLAFAPGIDPSALQITVDKGLLVIAGERSEDKSVRKDGDAVYANERFVGSFRRVVSLPDDADATKVDAKYRDGVLHITVAKRESSKPRQITVN